MNIYDIAEKCGVSIATVSRVLNNNPNVSAATRERILAVIEEENYTLSANVFLFSLEFPADLPCESVVSPTLLLRNL